MINKIFGITIIVADGGVEPTAPASVPVRARPVLSRWTNQPFNKGAAVTILRRSSSQPVAVALVGRRFTSAAT